MIFYFTGTGNSQYLAQKIAANTNNNLYSIADCMKKKEFTFKLEKNEAVGIVCPIYFWGLPSIMVDFISHIELINYSKNYIYAAFSCGGSTGATDRMLSKALRKKGYKLNGAFSVIMPDNYILMFDLKTPDDKIDPILKNAEPTIDKIISAIKEHSTDKSMLNRGFLPILATTSNYPIYKYGRKTKPFHVTSDCTGCEICVNLCPCEMISMENNLPVWKQGKCTQCLACIHHCPVQAIQYGKKTYKRGRYTNPNI